MTKQHFQAFADEIKCAQVDEQTRIAIAHAVANVARQFNGRFDVDRFMRAAGLDGK